MKQIEITKLKNGYLLKVDFNQLIDFESTLVFETIDNLTNWIKKNFDGK